MKSLILVTLAFGLFLPVQMTGKEKHLVQQVKQPVVIDADGDELGSVLGLNGPAAVVLIDIGGNLFSINAFKDGLTGVAGPLVFATTNCTGTPYVPWQLTGLVTPSTIAPPGNSLYAAKPNASPQTITVGSYLPSSAPGGPPAPCQLMPPPPPPAPQTPPQWTVVPAQRLLDLNAVFTPPFSIRAGH